MGWQSAKPSLVAWFDAVELVASAVADHSALRTGQAAHLEELPMKLFIGGGRLAQSVSCLCRFSHGSAGLALGSGQGDCRLSLGIAQLLLRQSELLLPRGQLRLQGCVSQVSLLQSLGDCLQLVAVIMLRLPQPGVVIAEHLLGFRLRHAQVVKSCGEWLLTSHAVPDGG